MAKKASGKTYTSKGERASSVKAGAVKGAAKWLAAQAAWISGKNPWVTIANPNKNETNKRFIRMRYNDLQKGSYKELEKKMFSA